MRTLCCSGCGLPRPVPAGPCATCGSPLAVPMWPSAQARLAKAYRVRLLAQARPLLPSDIPEFAAPGPMIG